MTAGGVVTTLGTGDGIDGRGMAFDDFKDILYATDNSGGLYTVNTATETSTLIGDMGLGSSVNRIGSAYDKDPCILYANNGSVGNLYTFTSIRVWPRWLGQTLSQISTA